MNDGNNNLSYDVRLYKIDEYVGKRRTSYRVRWSVAGKIFPKTHATKKLAESFLSKLTTAAREGVPFDVRSGLPLPMARQLSRRSWFHHACEYVDVKWPHISPGHRRGISETLTQATLVLLSGDRGQPEMRRFAVRCIAGPSASPLAVERLLTPPRRQMISPKRFGGSRRPPSTCRSSRKPT